MDGARATFAPDVRWLYFASGRRDAPVEGPTLPAQSNLFRVPVAAALP